MRWDRHTFTALGGIAALLIVSALLLEDAHALFTPVPRRPPAALVAGIIHIHRIRI